MTNVAVQTVSSNSVSARAKSLALKEVFRYEGRLKRARKVKPAVIDPVVTAAKEEVERLEEELRTTSSAAACYQVELELDRARRALHVAHLPPLPPKPVKRPVVALPAPKAVETPKPPVVVVPEPKLEPKPPVIDATEIERRAEQAAQKPAEAKPKPELKLVPRPKTVEPSIQEIDEQIAAIEARMAGPKPTVHKRSHEGQRLRAQLIQLRQQKKAMAPAPAKVLGTIKVEPRGPTKHKPMVATKADKVIVNDPPKKQKGGRRNNA
ncbi:hypothetical protein EPO34_01800 [Patescibacteria group bacterium]|nr:MAG: hypothetical protein EPO34_01800 [Patescibacteria group bacterium]